MLLRFFSVNIEQLIDKKIEKLESIYMQFYREHKMCPIKLFVLVFVSKLNMVELLVLRVAYPQFDILSPIHYVAIFGEFHYDMVDKLLRDISRHPLILYRNFSFV